MADNSTERTGVALSKLKPVKKKLKIKVAYNAFLSKFNWVWKCNLEPLSKVSFKTG